MLERSVDAFTCDQRRQGTPGAFRKPRHFGSGRSDRDIRETLVCFGAMTTVRFGEPRIAKGPGTFKVARRDERCPVVERFDRGAGAIVARLGTTERCRRYS